MEIIKTVATRKDSSWQEIAKALRAGSIKEIIGIGDRLTVSHKEYGLLEFDVLDFDRDAGMAPCPTVTLQLHDLTLPNLQLNNNNRNSWEESSIRAWLGSRKFIDGFDPEFASLITPVSKITNPDSEKEEHTEDSFFLLSLEEIDKESCYAYYSDRRGLVKFNSAGCANWWWLRSAWCVSSSGYVEYSYYGHTAVRCAPACVIC